MVFFTGLVNLFCVLDDNIFTGDLFPGDAIFVGNACHVSGIGICGLVVCEFGGEIGIAGIID